MLALYLFFWPKSFGDSLLSTDISIVHSRPPITDTTYPRLPASFHSLPLLHVQSHKKGRQGRCPTYRRHIAKGFTPNTSKIHSQFKAFSFNKTGGRRDWEPTAGSKLLRGPGRDNLEGKAGKGRLGVGRGGKKR